MPDPGLVNGGLAEASDEDCLYLDVFVPEVEAGGRLPVLVWLHGGGYTTGAGISERYGPLLYLSHEVLLVEVRYRLGPLGFLSLGTEDVPGNAGVRDQLAALTWVQDNIHSFGGDPSLVTVYGQSAGSFASTYHIMSPLARWVSALRQDLISVSEGCSREQSCRAEWEGSPPPIIISTSSEQPSTAVWPPQSWAASSSTWRRPRTV